MAATSSVAAIVLIVLVARPGGGELSRARLAFAPSDVAASCGPLTPASLTRADLAFEASVERVSGSQVVLRRGETFKGSVADELLAEQQPAGSLVGPFRTGQRYFLAVKGGRVLTCGESALATPRLRAIYDRAF